ncbi:MAG TPA: GldG family protein [Nitrosospira sp.]|nr:GldG family protein [Nitrosospira sp.]
MDDSKVIDKRRLYRFLVQSTMFVILLILSVGLAGYVAWETRFQWDVSQNQLNSLSEESLEVLRKIDGPLKATVYASSQDAQSENVAKIIRDFLTPYQLVKSDFEVVFVDPDELPRLADQAGVEVNGEMVVEYNGRRERVNTFNEQAFANVLFRLARSNEKLLAALSGHGEPKLDGMERRDLGEFGKQLVAKGFKIRTLNLTASPEVPKDTSVLVISSPQFDLSEGEVDKVLAYIADGGNLLWLLDQEPLHGLQPLAEKLQLTLSPGVVIDAKAQKLRLPITFSVVAAYGQHPVTHNFDYMTVFPFSRQITINENEEWRSVSLVEAAETGWVETGNLEGGAKFDAVYDVPGPVSIAAALSRQLNEREQRVAVVGSSYFVANTYLGYGRNADFGANLVNWLAGDDDLIAIPPPVTRDNSLTLSDWKLSIIALSFLIVMPLIFLASGTIIWWKRRRR